MTLFNETQLSILIPSNKKYLDWFPILNEELPKYNIDSKERVAAFMSQCGHESLDFTVLVENLSYSADALLRVFPKYFKTADDTSRYARQSEKIANRVYANRMGNGDEASGEGWKFRGRGLIQITGKNNYRASSLFLFYDESILDKPQHYSTIQGAIQSACWFWTANKLNDIADRGDLITLTKQINGGTIGLQDRQERYEKALLVL